MNLELPHSIGPSLVTMVAGFEWYVNPDHAVSSSQTRLNCKQGEVDSGKKKMLRHPQYFAPLKPLFDPKKRHFDKEEDISVVQE